jgi:hypothetical protein
VDAIRLASLPFTLGELSLRAIARTAHSPGGVAGIAVRRFAQSSISLPTLKSKELGESFANIIVAT